MPRVIVFFILFIGYGFCFKHSFLGAQNKSSLEKKSKLLKAELKKLSNQSNLNRKKTLETTRHLSLLLKQIKNRKELISLIDKEIKTLDNDIEKGEIHLNKLKKELYELKKVYGAILVRSYKNKTENNKFFWLLASHTLSQVHKRLKYIEKYSAFQKKRAKGIQQKQQQFNDLIKRLRINKKEKSEILLKKEKEKKALEKEQGQKDKLILRLNGEKKKLVFSIEKKQKELKRLDGQIKALIKREIELSRQRMLKANKENVDRSKKITTPIFSKEAIKLSEDFAKNRGKLPWPVQGSLFSYFGKQSYKGLKNVYIENNGIEILAKKEDPSVRAVFNGIISAVYPMGNNFVMVLIQHGDYYSVYGNLDRVKVKKGEKVTTGQIIGKIGENMDSQSILNFQIWHNVLKENPAIWLRGL